MKWFIPLFASLLSLSANAADAELIQGVTCAITIRVGQTTLFNFGDMGKNRLTLPINDNVELRDKLGRKWTFRFDHSPITLSGFNLKNGELLIKKDRPAEERVDMRVNITTGAFKAPIKGPAKEIMTDMYVIEAAGSPESRSLKSFGGSYSSKVEQYVDCEVSRRDVNYADFRNGQ